LARTGRGSDKSPSFSSNYIGTGQEQPTCAENGTYTLTGCTIIREKTAASLGPLIGRVQLKNMPEAEMIASPNRANFPKLGFAVIFFAFAVISPRLSPAQERYPAVARISFVSGPVSYSR